jgi:hypothetical protein
MTVEIERMKFKTGHVVSISEVTQVRSDAMAVSDQSDLSVRSVHVEQFLCS